MIQIPSRSRERRRALRIPVCLSVNVECDAWMGACFTKDISETGLYLIGQQQPSMSTGFTIEVALPGDLGTLRTRAVSVRVQPDGPRGFGLDFRDLKPTDQATLSGLRERWELAFPVQHA